MNILAAHSNTSRATEMLFINLELADIGCQNVQITWGLGRLQTVITVNLSILKVCKFLWGNKTCVFFYKASSYKQKFSCINYIIVVRIIYIWWHGPYTGIQNGIPVYAILYRCFPKYSQNLAKCFQKPFHEMDHNLKVLKVEC